MRRAFHFGMMVALAATWHTPALGCAACFGKSDSTMAYGMNAGIMTLLAVILSMLGLITSFFVFIVRRAGQTADPASSNPPPSSSPSLS